MRETAAGSVGAGDEPKGRNEPESRRDTPELEVTIILRQRGNRIIATERFALPLSVNIETIARRYGEAVQRVIDVWMKK